MLQFLLKLKSKISNNNSQLEHAPSLSALLDKYEDRLYLDETENATRHTVKNESRKENPPTKEQTNQTWISELTPCLKKLLSAAQGLVKTLRLVHGILRLREELPRSAIAHSLQHRRDVCFSQAVSRNLLF